MDLGMPTKDKTFSWLLIEDKLLTWNNLLKRGWQGPRLCLLCRGNEETVFHLFVQCPFTVSIWNKILNHFKLVFGWSGSTVLECFDYWMRRNYAYSSLPTFICWYIWNERNLAIFESKSPSIEKIFFLSIVVVADHSTLKTQKSLDALAISCPSIESLVGLMGHLKEMGNKVEQGVLFN
jgi:hypothetical protein